MAWTVKDVQGRRPEESSESLKTGGWPSVRHGSAEFYEAEAEATCRESP